jgi:hypothetical protein
MICGREDNAVFTTDNEGTSSGKLLNADDLKNPKFLNMGK